MLQRTPQPMSTHPLVALLSCLALPAGAAPDAISQTQSVWRDGDTGVDVAMYDCDEDPALLCGRIVGLPPRSAETDVHNPDVRLRQRRLLGLEIVSGFRPAGPGCWQGGGEQGRLPGRIYLPVNGDTLGDDRNRYEICIEDDRLVIRIANCSLLACLGKRVWQRADACPTAEPPTSSLCAAR